MQQQKLCPYFWQKTFYFFLVTTFTCERYVHNIIITNKAVTMDNYDTICTILHRPYAYNGAVFLHNMKHVRILHTHRVTVIKVRENRKQRTGFEVVVTALLL